MRKQWRIAESCPHDFCSIINKTPLFAQLLWNRGVRTLEEIQSFLYPDFDRDHHHPAQFRHMSSAIQRVFQAIESGERITVHGDYDADGVTGSALLISALQEVGRLVHVENGVYSSIDYYIPHREKEGYGLHPATVSLLKERGTNLIITVDCGIACVDEIAFAKSEDMDVIVIDHHVFGDVLPDAYLIHPGLAGESYPFKSLAAVGVAYQFACAFLDEARARGLNISSGWEKWLLDLVAIATVTDMVPMIGENRLFEMYGLKVLNKTRRPGLRALIEAAGLTFGSMDSESIGFAIGPRLNAAGRMDHAELALKLLLSGSEDEARTYVLALEKCNRERQDTTRKIVEEARKRIMSPVPHMIMMWDKAWSPALVGLVAGKFTDEFARPSIIVGYSFGNWIGSGRSTSSYNITHALRTIGDGCLRRIGGHAQACGFTINTEEHIAELASRMTRHASEFLKADDLVPVISIDAEIFLDQIDIMLSDFIETLEPFGVGNMRPIFISRRCFVATCDTIGSLKNHIRLTLVTAQGRRIKAIGFKMGDRFSEISVGGVIDLVYHIAVNRWQGTKTIECRIIDFLCISSSEQTVERAEIQVQPESAL